MIWGISVESLLHDLGIDLKAIIIQAIGFLLLLTVLWRFAFGKIGQVLEARRNEIHSRIQKLEEGQRELEHLKAELQNRLDQIETEARTKLQNAINEANAEKGRIVERARQEAESELARAFAEIQAEKERAISELRANVADLAIAAAEKILEANLDDQKHRKLVDDFIKQLP